MLNTLAVVLLLMILPACNSHSPAALPLPSPPSASPPNYSGIYMGPVLYNLGNGEVATTGSTGVSHSGDTIIYDPPFVTTPSVTVTIALTGGPLSRDGVVTGTRTYYPDYFHLPDCGAVTVRTTSRFAGRLLNITVDEEYERCNRRIHLVGELERQEP